MWYKWFYKGPIFLILIGGVLLLAGYVVMALWNALIPDLFNGPVLSFWQSVGILLLIKILFHSPRCWGGHNWHPSYHRHWKHRFEEKLAAMKPEEREKFREEWRKRCNPRYWDYHHSEKHKDSEDTPSM